METPAKLFKAKLRSFLKKNEKAAVKLEEYFDVARPLGKELIALIEENNDTLSLLAEEAPRIPRKYWKHLIAIGHGTPPEKLLLPEPGIERAIRVLEDKPAKLTEVMTKPLSVVVADGNGGSKVATKTIEQLTPSEAIRVITNDGAASIEEQTRKLDRESARAKQRDLRYVATNEGVHWQAHSFFTWAQLEEIIARHRPKAVADLEAQIKKQQIDKRPRV